MDEMRITGIGPIVTAPASDARPGSISIEVLTSEDQQSLVMSGAVAMELAAAIIRHLRQEQSLSGEETDTPKKAE